MSADAHPAGLDGDLLALANASYDHALVQTCEVAKTISFAEAVAFARSASCGWIGTVRVFLEWQFADHLERIGADDLALHYRASALNLAEALGDCGDDAMAEMVVRAGPALPAAIFAEAQRQRAEPDTSLAAGVDRAGDFNPNAGIPAPPPGYKIN